MKRQILFFVGVLILIATFAGCASGPTAPPSVSSPTPTAEQPTLSATSSDGAVPESAYEDLLRGDFSYFVGVWANAENSSFTLNKDGSITDSYGTCYPDEATADNSYYSWGERPSDGVGSYRVDLFPIGVADPWNLNSDITKVRIIAGQSIPTASSEVYYRKDADSFPDGIVETPANGALGSDPLVKGFGEDGTGFVREMEKLCLFRVQFAAIESKALSILFDDAYNNAYLACSGPLKYISVELWSEDRSARWVYTIMPHDENTAYGDRMNPAIENLNDWARQDQEVIRTVMNAIIEHNGILEKVDLVIRDEIKNAIEIWFLDAEGKATADFEYLNGFRPMFD